jgi:hypothetical protein
MTGQAIVTAALDNEWSLVSEIVVCKHCKKPGKVQTRHEITAAPDVLRVVLQRSDYTVRYTSFLLLAMGLCKKELYILLLHLFWVTLTS